MSISILAGVLLGCAGLLALGFHRHRAAQVAVLLSLMLAGAVAADPRWPVGALRFAPALLLLFALLPESRLLSLRHLAFVLAALLLTGTTLDAPAELFDSMSRAAAWPFAELRPERSAALFLLVAAGVCAFRGVWRGPHLEFGLAAALLLAVAGLVDLGALAAWFAGAALVMMFAILHAGYRMAFADQLTGLPNRRALDETLARLSGSYSLAMVDVDHFKSFNDTYGHDAGDVVLREVARNLRRHAGGRVFRYGGEEFCVVYAGQGSAAAAERLERARQYIEAQHIQVAAAAKRGRKRAAVTQTVSVTVSAGCAPRDPQRRAYSDVLKAADQALYKAKGRGRNRIVKVG